MPIRTHAELLKRYLQGRGDFGITVLPATEPPTTTTTFDAIMKPPRAETPASSDETPEERDATPDNGRGLPRHDH